MISLSNILGRITNIARTKPAEPGESGTGMQYVYRAPSGTHVDEYTALKFSAVFSCIRVIAETMGAMSMHALQHTEGGKRRAVEHPVDWLLSTQANPETTATTFRETLVAHALSWGNGYAEIERDRARRPVWKWQITPDRVNVDRTFSGRLVYDIRNDRQPNTVLEADDVYHLKGLGYDGLVGYSVISMAAQSIAMGLDAESYGASTFANGEQPGGILKTTERMEQAAIERLRKDWKNMHGGPQNRGRVAILEAGLEYQAIGITPEDAQFLQSRQFQVLDICRWFRVPPHKVADLTRATFSNIEHQSIEFVQDTILPWARRMETEADRKLFGIQQRGTYFSKCNIDSLLRGDNASRAAMYQAMFGMGAINSNEIREQENLNSIGPDGDKYLVQLNQTTLEKIGEEPVEPAPEPVEPAQPDDEPAQQEDEQAEIAAFIASDYEIMAKADRRDNSTAHLTPIFLDAARRVLNRERHRVEDAAKRNEGEAFNAWLDEFLKEQGQYAAETMAVPMRAMATVLNGGERELVEQRQDRRVAMLAAGYTTHRRAQVKYWRDNPHAELWSEEEVESLAVDAITCVAANWGAEGFADKKLDTNAKEPK